MGAPLVPWGGYHGGGADHWPLLRGAVSMSATDPLLGTYEGTIFRCEVCSRVFATHGAISTHDRSHTVEERMAVLAPKAEDYAFLLANVRDAVGDDG